MLNTQNNTWHLINNQLIIGFKLSNTVIIVTIKKKCQNLYNCRFAKFIILSVFPLVFFTAHFCLQYIFLSSIFPIPVQDRVLHLLSNLFSLLQSRTLAQSFFSFSDTDLFFFFFKFGVFMLQNVSQFRNALFSSLLQSNLAGTLCKRVCVLLRMLHLEASFIYLPLIGDDNQSPGPGVKLLSSFPTVLIILHFGVNK